MVHHLFNPIHLKVAHATHIPRGSQKDILLIMYSSCLVLIMRHVATISILGGEYQNSHCVCCHHSRPTTTTLFKVLRALDGQYHEFIYTLISPPLQQLVSQPAHSSGWPTAFHRIAFPLKFSTSIAVASNPFGARNCPAS